MRQRTVVCQENKEKQQSKTHRYGMVLPKNKPLMLILALLLCLCIPGVSAQVGVTLCACSPATYTFQLNFSYTCNDTTVEGAGLNNTECFVSPFGFDPENVTDFRPVAVNAVDIIELDQSLIPFSLTPIRGDYRNGNEFSYTSITATEPNLTSATIPGGLQMNIVGVNNVDQPIQNVWIIVFTSECGVFPIFTVGEQIGWTMMTDLSLPVEKYCPGFTNFPTTDPSVSASSPSPVEPNVPTVAPATRAPSNDSPVTIAPVTSPVAPVTSPGTIAPVISPATIAPVISPVAPVISPWTIAPVTSPVAPVISPGTIAPASDAPATKSPTDFTSLPAESSAPSEVECPPFHPTKSKGKGKKGTAKGKGSDSAKGSKGDSSSSGKSGKAMMEFPSRWSNGKAGMDMTLIYHKKDDTSGMSSMDDWQYEYKEKKSQYSQGDNRESKLEKSTSSHAVPEWNIYQMRSGKGYYGKLGKGSDSSPRKGLDSQGKGWGMPDPLCHPKSEKLLKSMGKGKGGVSKGKRTSKGTGPSSPSSSWSAKGGKGEPIESKGENKKKRNSSASKATKSLKMSKLSSCWSGKAGMKSYYGTASRTGTQTCLHHSLSSSGDETNDMYSSFKGGGDVDFHGSPSRKTSDNEYRHKPSWDEYSTKKLTKKKSKYSDMTAKSSKSKLKSLRPYNDDDGERLEHHQFQPSSSISSESPADQPSSSPHSNSDTFRPAATTTDTVVE